MTAAALKGNASPPRILGARIQRVVAGAVSRPWFWILAVGLLFGLPLTRSIQRQLPDPPPVLGTVPAFAMIDENGREVASESLMGKLWLVDFCNLQSPDQTDARMVTMLTIQHRLRFMGESVRMLTVSLQPERDTPEVMLEIVQQYKPNPQLWSFVSGADAAKLHDTLLALLHEQQEGLPSWTNLRDTHYGILVDPDMRVRGFYELKEETLDAMLLDMGLIANLYGPDDSPTETDA